MKVDSNLQFIIVGSGQSSSGVEGDLKKGLLKDLQKVYNGLTPDTIIFFNGLKSDKEKKDYLGTILSTKEKQCHNIVSYILFYYFFKFSELFHLNNYLVPS